MKAALCLAIMAPMAYAANLADVIKSNPQLQKVAALISSNPTWATVPNGVSTLELVSICDSLYTEQD
ncbi:hypothetical protein O5D80_002535 [Batrachochytrium dendrobatidis]|nr:hypothetical protein O5D80_002535 [Batrachochytrium dendrobatidis]